MNKFSAALLAAAALLVAAPALAQAPQRPPAAAPAPAAQLIDINSASPDQLEKLKGIGKARAEAIVKGRPYRGKDELPQKGVIPQAVYDDIKDQIVARQR